ncbi:MAG: sigma-70 family RNA polymerase sigma factor [Bacilli bacterium]|nr:sigma-70 family RNA polymerase sigma factor [Bacilli bacterium]
MVAEQVILDNQRLVYSATKYFGKYQDKEDLIQEGNLGFVKAMHKFDETKGAKATTYAYDYILGEMRKHVRDDRGIKISRDITKLNLMIEKASIMLSQKLMREPTVGELSHYLEVDEREIVMALKSINVLQSMDSVVSSDDKDLTYHDVIAEEKPTDFDRLIDLESGLQSLSLIERQIIMYRYLKDLTQAEVAKMLGISQVQVSRWESKTLAKLRSKLS